MRVAHQVYQAMPCGETASHPGEGKKTASGSSKAVSVARVAVNKHWILVVVVTKEV